MVAKRLVRQSSAGYQHLLRSESVGTILGADVVNVLCDALDDIKDDRERLGAAQGTCEGLIRVSLAGHRDGPGFDRLENIREHGRQINQSPVKGLVAFLRTLEPPRDLLAQFAARVCSGKVSRGDIAISTALLRPLDALASLFLDRLLQAAFHVKLDAPVADAESPLAQIESIVFPDCRDWLVRELPSWIVKDGRLNRYGIDLMWRQNLPFVESADKALQQVHDAADGIFILRLLASRTDRECLRLLGRSVEQVFEVAKDGVEVRRTALELLERLTEWLKV